MDTTQFHNNFHVVIAEPDNWCQLATKTYIGLEVGIVEGSQVWEASEDLFWESLEESIYEAVSEGKLPIVMFGLDLDSERRRNNLMQILKQFPNGGIVLKPSYPEVRESEGWETFMAENQTNWGTGYYTGSGLLDRCEEYLKERAEQGEEYKNR